MTSGVKLKDLGYRVVGQLRDGKSVVVVVQHAAIARVVRLACEAEMFQREGDVQLSARQSFEVITPESNLYGHRFHVGFVQSGTERDHRFVNWYNAAFLARFTAEREIMWFDL